VILTFNTAQYYAWQHTFNGN